MNNFDTISKGIKGWNKTGRSLKEADEIFRTPVEFLVSELPVLDDSSEYVNIYLGYNEETSSLFITLIQSGRDTLIRYKEYPEEIAKEIVLIEATKREFIGLGGTDHSIEAKEASKRIKRWQNERLRMKVMKRVKSAPLIFEIPKSNFEVKKIKRLLFGIKRPFLKRMDYDLILEAEDINTDGITAGQIFYDTARPVPPFKPIGSKGLHEFLELPSLFEK